LIEKLSRELKAFQSKLIETSYQTIEARLSRLLLLMADKFGVKKDLGINLDLELSRSELAEMAGVTPETVIRTLSKLRKKDLIELNDTQVLIKDKESLEELTKPLPIILAENIL
jgi:CRP/FNR family transcriptional regulator